MSAPHDPFHDRLAAWLRAEAPAEAPDAILDAVASRIDDLDPERTRQAGRGLRLLASAAVVVAVLVGGWAMSRTLSTPSPGVTAPSAVPRPADIPRDGTCAPDRECFGLLRAGAHRTTVFSPSLSFAVPDGWENLEQSGGQMDLRPVDRPGDAIEIAALPQPRAANGLVLTDVPATADGLAAWLAARGDLATDGVHHARVTGALVPYVDLAVAPDAPRAMSGCPADPCVALALGLDPRPRPTWSWDLRAWRGAAYRVYVVGDGPARFLVIVTSWDAAERDAVLAAALPVVDSLARATP
jgi:hypothetical protein